MIVMVAGPYSAPTEEGRVQNLERLNKTALAVFEAGHIPLVGVAIALSFLRQGKDTPNNDDIMEVSIGLVDRCDAVLLVAPSPGALRECAEFQRQGKPIFRSIEDLKASIRI